MNNKKPRTTKENAFFDVCQREVGQLSSRNFTHRLGAAQDFVLRLEICRKLVKHRGCVNTISFNLEGNMLVSSSDDRRVILWNWETGNPKLVFQSGHNNNVFQAKFMPYTDDRSIVTCAADGQVRHARILEHGEVTTTQLAKHEGSVHKLAIEPGSSHIFYSCGEDGLVQHIDLRTRSATELFTCQSIDDRWTYMPVISLHAIAIDPRNPNLFAVAGSDVYTRLYDIRSYKWDGSSDFGQPVNYFCPPHMIGDTVRQAEITGLAFSEQSELLVSYTDEFIYLFTQDMGLGPNPVSFSSVFSSDGSEAGSDQESAESSSPMQTDNKVAPQVYTGHKNCETVKGVSFFGPKCDYVVSGSDCGRIFIWKKKGGQLIRVMEGDNRVVNCIEPHPHTLVLASSGIDTDIKIWTPKASEKAILPTNFGQDLDSGKTIGSAKECLGLYLFNSEDLPERQDLQAVSETDDDDDCDESIDDVDIFDENEDYSDDEFDDNDNEDNRDDEFDGNDNEDNRDCDDSDDEDTCDESGEADGNKP